MTGTHLYDRLDKTAFCKHVLESQSHRWYGPVFGSWAVHNAHVLISVVLGLAYTYFAICPPHWMHLAVRAIDAPHFTEHAIGLIPIMIGLWSYRDNLARTLLHSCENDIHRMFNHCTLIDRLQLHAKSDIRIMAEIFVTTIIWFGIFKLLIPEYPYRATAFILPMYFVGYFRYEYCAVVIKAMIELSRLSVDAMCADLETKLTELDGVQSQRVTESELLEIGTKVNMEDTNFWLHMTQKHRCMDEDLEKLWSVTNGGAVILADMCFRVVGFLAGATLTACVQSVPVRVAALVGTTTSILRMLLYLKPTADVTSLCQDTRANYRSILRLTKAFVNHPQLSSQARIEQARFLQYVSIAPSGIELPLIGLVTLKLLRNRVKIVATAAPTVLAFMLKAW